MSKCDFKDLRSEVVKGLTANSHGQYMLASSLDHLISARNDIKEAKDDFDTASHFIPMPYSLQKKLDVILTHIEQLDMEIKLALNKSKL